MACLAGFGHFVPERVVANDELARDCAVDPGWILEVSGIRERRYAAVDETVVSLGVHAAVACLDRTGVAAAELGMLLVSSGSADRFCPGPASSLAAALGLSSTPALDIPTASAGSLTGLALAAALAPAAGPVLVVASEIMSRRVDRTPYGKNTAILFGDGAGAALVVPDGHPAGTLARVAGDALFTDGSAAEILAMELNPAGQPRLHMEGGAVILQASRKLPRAIAALLERFAIPPAAVGDVLMHQANLNLIQRVARAVSVEPKRFFVNIDRYGNTSSASLLLAASEWQQARGGAPVTTPLLFAAFGAGLNWGALLALPR